AATVTAVATAVPMFVVGLLADSVRMGIGLAVGCVVGALGYSAVFLALSLLTRRPVLLGLIYVLLWEGLLGNLVVGTRVLSIEQYVVTIADRIAPTPLLNSHVSLPAAVVMSAVVLVGATALAIDRLRSFTLTGETS